MHLGHLATILSIIGFRSIKVVNSILVLAKLRKLICFNVCKRNSSDEFKDIRKGKRGGWTI